MPSPACAPRLIFLLAPPCLGLAGLLLITRAAACELPFGGDLGVILPAEIIVPPATAIGSRVAGPYYSAPAYSSDATECGMGWTSAGQWDMPTSEWANFIYTTNIPGIGLRVHRHTEGRQAEAYPFRIFSAIETTRYDRHHHVVEFFRIGEDVDGTLTPGRYVSFTLNGQLGTTLQLDAVRFVKPAPTCDFSQGNVHVDLGDQPSDGFTAVGAAPTPWTTFALRSAGCQYAITIAMRFIGAANPDDAALFATRGDAEGIGIEVQTAQGTPVIPNADAALEVPASDAPQAVQFRARYRQTQPRVSPGTADATATVLLEYR